MKCPACGYEPTDDGGPSRGVNQPDRMRDARPKQEMWLDYIAHLLEHQVTPQAPAR